MTSVSITTYSETLSSENYATIYSIDQPMEKISKKAGFHLMKDFDMDLATRMSFGNFSDYEITMIGTGGRTFEIIRSSISIDHIIARRIADFTTSGMFVHPIYLQDNTMTLTNVEFYVTGEVIRGADPMSIHMENIYIDTSLPTSGFMFTQT